MYWKRKVSGGVPAPIHIQSKWGSKCPQCDLPIDQGAMCEFIPAHFIHGVEVKGLVRHLPGQCGSVYVVAAIYWATRKTIKVPAFSPEDALTRALPKFKGKLKGSPVEYHVMQGNFTLLRRSA